MSRVLKLAKFVSLSWLVLVSAALLACGGSDAQKPAATPAKRTAKARPKVKRALSAEQLQHAMKSRATAMAACYELSPAKEKQLAGDLTVDFTVEPSGQVSGESVVSDALADKLLSECVLGVVKKTEFPRSEAAVDVSWPLHFGGR